ncbi:hypothetical protein BJY04DRAFT_21231 [Aspergillus karnatakaensis]|uniref:uncharacterized protein n=1 Tax=Aspergillus karnatakaensis TaxID=1810916 RepID=UPI003CCDA7B6
MPNPADLPPELFNIILTHALHDSDGPYHLCALSLLSRKWYAALVHRIYSEWSFNGARQPFITLWKFLVTVLRDQHLAAQVQTLRIGNWGFYPESSRPNPDLQLSPPELDLIRRAIYHAGVAHLEEEIMESLPKRDRRPLMALLLTSLPNLSTVFAHIPRSDPFLAAVIKQAAERQIDESQPTPALSKVSELYLCQETPVDVPRQPEDSDPDSDEEEEDSFSREALRLDDLWPVFSLQKLKNLSLIDFDTDGAAVWLKKSGISHIENLFLTSNWKSLCGSADLEALINKPQALKTLVCTLHDNPFESRRNEVVSNSQLWSYLQRHKGTLETLDISRSKTTHRDENGRFDKLGILQNLKHLRIQSEIILGGCCGSLRAPFRLKDTLPPTIETLTLYGNEGFDVITDLSVQLEEVVRDRDHFPSLHSIFLDDVPALFTDDGQWPQPAWTGFVRICKQRHINLKVDEVTNMLGMLSYKELWEKTLYMQADGEERNAAVAHNMKGLRDRQELLLRSKSAMDDGSDNENDHHNAAEDKDLHKYPVDSREPVKPVPFTDHTGRTAYMVFKKGTIPPLFSFSIYFTHLQATPQKADMLALEKEITPYDTVVRYDMYFLPGASAEECITHYNGEKAVRGSYKDQIKSLRAAPHTEVRPLSGTSGQLPGMVTRYVGISPHRAELFVSPDEDWREGLIQVLFDRKESATLSRHGPDNPPAEVIVSGRNPLNDEDPHIHTMDFDVPVSEMIFDAVYRVSTIHQTTWQRAMYRGWGSW